MNLSHRMSVALTEPASPQLPGPDCDGRKVIGHGSRPSSGTALAILGRPNPANKRSADRHSALSAERYRLAFFCFGSMRESPIRIPGERIAPFTRYGEFRSGV
ncbi:hypothetical protein [Stenotrophomonas sp. PS02297]|uniref:hypothetical protein n=1 Tax=Stenotrophomonas sp. PS02297 TaxID=2991423 RepID=UPI00249C6480|nr:hypothetical protein [Stenotrophomonas sp. PS02297]